MDELKTLIELVKSLPNAVLLVLAGFLFYKLAVLGSVYATIRFTADKLYQWQKAKIDAKNNPPPVELRGTINAMCITSDSSHLALMVQIDRIRGKGVRLGSTYIHGCSVDWLREAIDAKEELDRAKAMQGRQREL